ncbi:N2227-like protein [Martensiomyces pterosporus]|nr:N2227-like protein [Martensiomyces pterosporus]
MHSRSTSHAHPQEHEHGHEHDHGGVFARRAAGRPLVEDHHMEKLYSTLKQFVRDWSAEGREEREQTYGPLLNALEREFAHVKPESRGAIRVLVPGAGLGRLAFDICCRGFSSQGNEFSYFMLLASNYVLNKTERVSQHAIYPFVHQFSNVVKEEDQVRAVRIPDILPSQMPFADTAEFSMTAGDFIEVYGAEDEKGRWDAIVTCFFMDTAKNVLAYLDTMWSAMKPGAVWINLGPLLWHFDSVQGESSVEFTREEFMALAEKIGFVWDGEQFQECIPVSYTSNSRSMLQYTYRAFMTVAHKPNQAAGNTIAN